MISLPWRAISTTPIHFRLVEPSTRFELVTPSLPRTCSTPELRGPFQVSRQKDEGRSAHPRWLLTLTLKRPEQQKDFCLLPSDFCLLERETGFEPATNSLRSE